MSKYLIDANLPYYFLIWHGPEYTHVKDLDDAWTDAQIWNYAKDNALTIVSKDTDFSNMVLLSSPPRVIQICFGNLKMREFHQIISRVWSKVCQLSEDHRLIRIYKERIEAIE